MTGPKPPKVPGIARATFAENVRYLMDKKYALSSNKPKSLAVDAGMVLSSVQRTLSGNTAPTLDTVEAFAKALDVHFSALLIPHVEIDTDQVRKPDFSSAAKKLTGRDKKDRSIA